MGQKKLVRFAAIKEFKNVLEFPSNMAGQWQHFFERAQPLTLELACGKGEYTLGLARLHPDQNFLGVDLKGNRIWVGANKALEEGLTNAGFLRTQIEQIADYFAPGEVKSIWITFPDPQLRYSKAKKRLTHPIFLKKYQQILTPGGYIHVKTDSPDLYRFTLLVIELYGCVLHKSSDNVYGESVITDELKIKTHYESLDIAGSKKIHYICFSLPAHLAIENDQILKEKMKEDEGID
ncbi:MAG: tRNA (guanosine(46)-N7)-methyltransferase TrmB [Sphingomonadales bacterium]